MQHSKKKKSFELLFGPIAASAFESNISCVMCE